MFYIQNVVVGCPTLELIHNTIHDTFVYGFRRCKIVDK